MAETSKSLKILNIQLKIRRFCYHGIQGIVVYSYQPEKTVRESQVGNSFYGEAAYVKIVLDTAKTYYG